MCKVIEYEFFHRHQASEKCRENFKDDDQSVKKKRIYSSVIVGSQICIFVGYFSLPII